MERYALDKRIIKKLLIKYGLILLCCLPVLLVIDYFMAGYNSWAVIGIDVAVMLFVIILVWLIEFLIKRNKQKDPDKTVIKRKK